jgi:TonB family protein
VAAAAAEPKLPAKKASDNAPAPAPTAVAVAKPAVPPPSAKPEQPVVSSVKYAAGPAKENPRPDSREESPRRKNQRPALIGAAVAVVALLGGGFLYLQSQKAESNRLALEKKNTELRLQAEEKKSLESEERARRELESRKKFEFEAAAKITAAETARAQAELEARRQTAARLANARGTLVITTVPANATVTVGDLPPAPAPATFGHLPIGRHAVTVALAHYDPVQFEVEIKENATTSPDPVTLTRVVGAVALESEPASADYEIKPANAFSLALEGRRSGKTPAKIDDLDIGDYTVTFNRAGWPAHTENVTVTRNATSKVAWTFPTGSIRFISTPAGAVVTRDGVQLGITPLSLNLPPGAAHFEIAMNGFDPVVLSRTVEAGGTQELSAQFPEAQRIYQAEEVDRQPEPIKSVKPELPYYLTMTSGRVEIQVIVASDGGIRDARVVHSTEADLRKYCLDALTNWKFKPGLKGGKPVNTRLTIPFVITKS